MINRLTIIVQPYNEYPRFILKLVLSWVLSQLWVKAIHTKDDNDIALKIK